MADLPENQPQTPSASSSSLSCGGGITPRCAIGLAVAIVGSVLIGNIWQTEPMLCANDGSRWNQVRSMFEHGRPWWYGHEEWFSTCDRCTYDKVDTDAEKKAARWYSSKPPLFQCIAYGVAWPFVRILGWDFKQHFGVIGRSVIIALNVVPMMLLLAFYGRFLLRVGAAGFSFAFCLASAAAGTYLTAWCVTLNNHVPGAICAFFVMYTLFAASREETVKSSRFVLAGLMSGLAFTLETPAAALIAASGLLLFLRDRRRTLILFVPAVLAVLVAYLAANKLCTGRWLAFQWTFPTFYDPYWRNPNPIDALNDPKLVYLFHLVIGHHGWFLLTPIFIVSVVGFVRSFAKKDVSLDRLALIAAPVSVAVFAFYVVKTNNYGGTTQGPRWLFWLIPLWLMMLPAGAEWFARRAVGRWAAIGMLAVSAFSMAYAMRIPWQRSWIHDILFWNGYVNF